MSFSFDAKFEVAKSSLPDKLCCAKAELSALFRTCGQLNLEKGSYSIELVTELPNLFPRINGLIKFIKPEFDELTLIKEERQNHSIRYHIGIPVSISKDLLLDCFVFRSFSEGEFEQIEGISRQLVENECCAKSYIKGAFLGCASANIVIKDINDLKKHTGGYHLEFVFNSQNLANDFIHLLSSQGIPAKIMQRKKLWVDYIKEAELVSDLLALVGANNAVLTLQNEFAVREVRNQLNRQLNCLNSNISKMVEASIKQIDAIEYISKTVGLETLSPTLYELCLLRLANPEETYENLAKLMTEPLTKSGVNHRLRKIVKIANDLKQNAEQDEKNDEQENQQTKEIKETEIKEEKTQEKREPEFPIMEDFGNWK